MAGGERTGVRALIMDQLFTLTESLGFHFWARTDVRATKNAIVTRTDTTNENSTERIIKRAVPPKGETLTGGCKRNSKNLKSGSFTRAKTQRKSNRKLITQIAISTHEKKPDVVFVAAIPNAA